MALLMAVALGRCLMWAVPREANPHSLLSLKILCHFANPFEQTGRFLFVYMDHITRCASLPWHDMYSLMHFSQKNIPFKKKAMPSPPITIEVVCDCGRQKRTLAVCSQFCAPKACFTIF